eukprot:jgi/Hompol1/3446/HPOL_003251-RA
MSNTQHMHGEGAGAQGVPGQGPSAGPWAEAVANGWTGEESMGTECAYVTLLTNEAYLPGALVVARSLRRTGTRHALVVLVAADGVSAGARGVLRRAFDAVVAVEPLRSHSAASAANLRLLGRPDLAASLTKLRAFDPRVIPFAKFVFLDADTLVRTNIDHLFATIDAPAHSSSLAQPPVFAAAPDVGWPDCFNSGVFVARPDAQIYSDLLRHLDEHDSFDGGDQGILNSFFSTWSHESPTNPRTVRLSFIYNVTPSAHYSYLPAFKQYGANIAIIHFIGELKPWKFTRFADGDVMTMGSVSPLVREFLQEWWAVFDEFEIHKELHDFKLDRDWSLYQPPFKPSYSTPQGSATGGYYEQPRRLVDSDFGNYRAEWSEAEIADELQGKFKSPGSSSARSTGTRSVAASDAGNDHQSVAGLDEDALDGEDLIFSSEESLEAGAERASRSNRRSVLTTAVGDHTSLYVSTSKRTTGTSSASRHGSTTVTSRSITTTTTKTTTIKRSSSTENSEQLALAANVATLTNGEYAPPAPPGHIVEIFTSKTVTQTVETAPVVIKQESFTISQDGVIEYH